MAMRSSQVPTWRGLLAFALAALLLAAAAPETEARTGLSGRRALKGAESAVRLTAGGTSATGGLGNAFTGGNSNRVSLTLGQPASSGTALTPPLGVLHTANPGATAASTAGSTPTPAVSLTILPAYVTGVTSATTSGATTPQTLQTQAAPFGMSFVDATGTAKGAGAGTALTSAGTPLTGGTATTLRGNTPFAGAGGKASGGGTALSGGTAVTINTKTPTKVPTANTGGKAAGGGTALTGGTSTSAPVGGGASMLAGASSEAGAQPCNAMSTYNTPSNCGRVPVASLAPTPVPTQPAGPVWMPTR